MSSTVKTLEPSEDLISDRFHDVFDTKLHFSTILEAQNQLISVPLGQFDFFDKLKISLVGFTQEPLPNFPELVHLTSQHYSLNEKVVLNSTHDQILFIINPQSVRFSLNLLENLERSLVSLT